MMKSVINLNRLRSIKDWFGDLKQEIYLNKTSIFSFHKTITSYSEWYEYRPLVLYYKNLYLDLDSIIKGSKTISIQIKLYDI